ncbi:MAG: exonuclease SbcCD subunit D [Firmicutes bacterium]|nr:exonuclease SbcCD subunit D [Bacillota bacterium]
MKIIHTADWHIGKIIHEYSMIEEQEYALKQFIDIVKEEKPHAVIIAGDIYDRSVAPAEAVELLDKVLGRIILELETPVIIVAGNHDSPERLSFGSGILRSKNLFIEGLFKKDIAKAVIYDDYGAVNFYLLPYTDPAIVRNTFQDSSIRTYDQAMGAIIRYINRSLNTNERNIMVTHGYVRGTNKLSISDSERPLSIGGADYVDINHFKDFHYTALGHLHRPQKAGSEKALYSGSLLKYSFSEVNHDKSVTIINMDSKGDIDIKLRSIVPRKDMRDLEGSLKDLLNPTVYKEIETEHFYRILLTDKGEILDPMGRLKSVYPNVMQIMIKERMKDIGEVRTAAAKGYREKSKIELFSEFYKSLTGGELEPENKEIMSKTIEEVEKRGDDFHEAY